ncbi:MAG: hypothetical protein QNJ60_14400 [Xenococcaceae cyanobacterium MO_188.B19]|nr:hypothetical protein [Xenococcaceae cyanobacterium MO_188.B19]
MKDKFYQFYDFSYNKGYPPFRGLVQPRLQNRINKLVELSQEWEETDFIEYFRQIVLDDSQSEPEKRFAHWHLVAYIDQARCYLIWRKCRHIPLYKVKAEDFYSFTNEILFQADKFQKYLKKYDSRHQSQASFKTYMLGVLNNVIREKLDDLEDLESDWHILCDVNTSSMRVMNNFAKKLKEALGEYGVTEPRISQYIFAWQYFVAIYKNNHIYQVHDGRSRWQEPNNSDFMETSNYYNSQKNQPNQPLQVASALEATPEIIQEWMEICIKSLRQYRKKIEVSFEAKDYENLQVIDNSLSSTFESEESLLGIEVILQEEIKKIEKNLPSVHRKVPLEIRQAIMPLCYSSHLAIFSQQQLADWLEINQGTIAHYIAKYIQKPLLIKFKELLKKQFNLSSYLNNFLQTRFTKPNNNILDSLLIKSIQQLNDRHQIILKLKYGENKTISEINLELNNDFIKENKIQKIELELKTIFQKEIEKWQKNYIKLWLRTYYQNKLQEILLKGVKQLNKIQKEIIQKKYCEKIGEPAINSLYPEHQTSLILEVAKKQVKEFFLQWFKNNFSLALKVADEQIIKIIEAWLSRELIYLEI